MAFSPNELGVAATRFIKISLLPILSMELSLYSYYENYRLSGTIAGREKFIKFEVINCCMI
jgi:hypothetical protein